MEITWYGHSCFRLSQRNNATVVTDPFDSRKIGFSPLRLKSDIVTISHPTPGHNHLEGVEHRHAIAGPGEYEIGGVFILGTGFYNTQAEEPRYNVIYVMDFDGLTVAHLGDLDHIPNQSEIDALGEIHIALVPVGGGGALNASQAAEVISLLEPSIVIPMHYKTPQCLLELETVERFLKEMGVSHVEEIDMFKIQPGTEMPEQTQIVLLSVKE